MLYLFLSIATSTCMAAVFKVSEGQNLNRNMITSVNYFAAVLVSLVMLLHSGIRISLNLSSWQAFFSEFSSVIQGAQFSYQGVSVFALILGLFTGILYFVGIIAFQLSVRNYGAGLSGMFNRAGVIIPIIFSIAFWHELPSSLQWLGIILALSGVVLVNISTTPGKKFEFHLPLIILMITGGFGALSSKLFQVYAPIEYRSLFLLFIFSTAMIISSIYAYRTALSWGRYELLAGVGVGICNQLSATFLLLSLNVLPGPVVYPLSAAGSIVLNNIMGMVFFNERLKAREWIAVGLTIVAVVLLA